MKYIILITIIFQLLPLCAIVAKAIDLDREPVYVRRGFDESWVSRMPDKGDKSWVVIPGVSEGKRVLTIGEQSFPEIPRRTMFSLKKFPPEQFTVMVMFRLTKELIDNNILGLYFPFIGENWSVYLNGRLLRSEIHLNERGEIVLPRHLRKELIPLYRCDIREGENILAVRLVCDVGNMRVGLHSTTPFIIDSYSRLESQRSEQIALIIIFIYLFLAFYHLIIYFMRREERFNLCYTAFTILLFVYLISRTRFAYSFIADTTMLHRIEYCSLYALVPTIGLFLDLIIKGRLSRFTAVYAAFSGLLIALTVIPASHVFARDILRVWQVTAIVPIVFYTFIRIGGAVYRTFVSSYRYSRKVKAGARVIEALIDAILKKDAGRICIWAAVLAGCAIFDILDSLFWSYNYIVSVYGFFAFTAGISLMLMGRLFRTQRDIESRSEMAKAEMELAGHIQKHLLTPLPEKLEGWELALAFKPRVGASGDFYDFYVRNSHLKGFALFDVSGHGVSSALITMIIKPVTYRLFNSMSGESLETIINLVDRHICSDLERLDNYVTCVLLRFEGDSVEYVNAGHPDILHRVCATGEVRSVGENSGTPYRGEPLGVGLDHRHPSTVEFRMMKGDILLIFTDCILDAQNRRNERYGIERLMESLKEAPDGSAAEMLDFIINRFFSFVNKDDLKDDLTVVLAKRTE